MYDLFFVSTGWASESVCRTCFLFLLVGLESQCVGPDFFVSTGWARESVCRTCFLFLLVGLESQCVGPVFCFYWLG